MSTKFLSPGWRMPRNANQSKSSNYSIDFNGSSQYLDLGDDDIFSFGNSTDDSPFSISAWIYMNDATSFRILNKYNAPNYEYQFDLSSSDKLQFYIFDGSNYRGVGYDSALSINQWYHVVATYDGRGGSSAQSGMVLYVNGSPVNDITYSSGSYTAMHNTTAPVNIGRIASSYANGKIDAVSIFDYALSSSQVTTLYGTGSAIGNPMALPSPPIAYYPLGTSAWNGQYLAENNAIGDYVFDFDGSNYIATGTTLTNLSVSTSFSISCWVKITSNVNYYHIVGAPTSYSAWNTGFGLYTNGSGIRFWVEQWNGENQFVETSSLNNGQWYHIGATFDTTNGLKLYVNAGTPTTATGTTIDGLSNTIFIGSTGTNTTYAFSGDLSNTQIWNTELSSSDIETLYNNGSPIRTLANIPQSSNLKAWYKLDSSEVYNSTTTKWEVNEATSPWTSSLDFNGSSDYVNINSVLTQLNSTTVGSWGCWVKPIDATPTSQNRIIQFGDTNGNGFLYIRIESDGKIGGQARNSGTSSWSFESNSPVFSNNTWTHIVLIQNGVQPKIYKNGVEVPITFTISTDKTAWFSDLPSLDNGRIGVGNQNNLGEFQFFEGSISNSSMWNIDLTPSQVTELYNNGTPSNLLNHSATSNLVSWWKLNNTTTGVEDAKGSNNGTNNGATEVYGSVSTLNGESSGMTQANLVQSDLQTVAPYSKYAMNFDAADSDNIIVNSNTGLNFGTGDFTYSLWGKINTTASNPGFYGGGSGNNNPSANSGYLSIGVHISQPTGYVGATRCWISGEVFNGTTIITDNNWHNIVLTRTSGVVQIYLDGNIEVMRDSSGTVVTNPTSSNSITNTNGITIGSFRNFLNYINGSMSNCFNLERCFNFCTSIRTLQRRSS